MVTAYLIEVEDSDLGGRVEEVLDGLAEVGTSGELTGLSLDAVEAECASVKGVRVRRLRLAGPESARRLREKLELEAEGEAVFACLPVAEQAPAVRVVAAGPRLPAMGRVPHCGTKQLRASLRYALGDLEADVESVFTEPSSLPAGDEGLLDRLRQLYGE